MQRFHKYFCAVLLLTAFLACNPQLDEAPELPPAPENASFSVQSGSEPNEFVLTSTAPDVFQFLWEVNGQSINGEQIEVFLPVAGTYPVVHTVFGRGGFARDSSVIVVESDAPFDCDNSVVFKFLSDCDQKSWRLIDPAVEAPIRVGPGDGSGTVWFAVDATEAAGRPCSFDDTWTFFEDGTMEFDANGDLFAEDFMGFPFVCTPEADFSPTIQPWTSGEHQFLTDEDANTITVNGLGAWIGLPKVTNGAEVTQPVSTTTYTVTRMESTPTGDILVLEVNFGPGVWTFTLQSI